MTDDILADWKSRKFILAPSYSLSEEYNTRHLVVLTDIGFWAEHAEKLKEWCKEHKAVTKGMTVELKTDEQLTLFCLRWS